MPKVSALTRIDHASEHGRWTLLRSPPSPALAPFVRQIEGYVEEGGPAVLRKELPSGRVPLILIFGPGFTLHDVDHPSRSRPLERSFIAGLHERHSLVGSKGHALCMQVDFTPLGARRFLKVELREIAGAVVDMNAIVGSLTDRLEERLSEATSWTERFATVEHFLLQRLMTPAREHRLLKVAWNALEASAGAIRIGKMASDLDCSRKHLVTLFQREIGLAPKTIARSSAILPRDRGASDQPHSHARRSCRQLRLCRPGTFQSRFCHVRRGEPHRAAPKNAPRWDRRHRGSEVTIIQDARHVDDVKRRLSRRTSWARQSFPASATGTHRA